MASPHYYHCVYCAEAEVYHIMYMTRFVTLRVWTQVHFGLGGNWGNSSHFRAATPWVR